MIKLRKDGQVILVPQSAYEKIYKPAGWVPLGQKRKSERAEAEAITESNSNALLLEELEMLVTVEELKTFAAEHGIDVEGLTTRRTIKAAIREFLEH